MAEARVDEKGRLKVPVQVQDYLRKFGDTRFFVTSLDGQTARLYPLSVWKSNEIFLQTPGPQAKAGKSTLLLANYFGHEAEIDAQGRLLLPSNLRRKLQMERVDVNLLCAKGQVTVYSSEKLEPAIEAALEAAAGAVDELESMRGFY
jgi:MraZ protein